MSGWKKIFFLRIFGQINPVEREIFAELCPTLAGKDALLLDKSATTRRQNLTYFVFAYHMISKEICNLASMF